MKFQILFVLLFNFSTGIGQYSEVDLNVYFTDTEIKDLNTITDFFQSEICGTKDREKFGKCVRNLVPDISELGGNFIERTIRYRKQKKLYNQISKSTFQKVWHVCKTVMVDQKYEFERLCFSGNSKFKNFVLELGKTSGYLSRYGQTLELGNMGNTNFIASNIVDFPKSMNIENRGVQIVFAIHYLTQNDHIKRDKKVKRLEKQGLRKLQRKYNKKTVPNKIYN
ncbi:MAG: hypothetical protein COA50_15660 [Flavobacteriaceae bacterium]|nr:MAG: hypothetical protein COA50_15660 [Flavobacteriaceae bacterium]